MTPHSVLSVDLGGTRIKVARVRQGRIEARDQLPAESECGIDHALSRLARTLRGLADSSVAGVAMGLPALVDSRSGRVLTQMRGKYEGLISSDLTRWASTELSLPIRIENDAHAAILGEWRHGCLQGCDDAVMITLGTGIGTSVLLSGRALRGRNAHAGNLGGHIVVDPNGFECICGSRGCVEAQQNLPAIHQIAREDSRWSVSALASVACLDYAALFEHRDHDALAHDLVERSLNLWGALVVSLIHQFNPERVVIGGGIIRSAKVIIPHLQRFADHACTPGGRVQVMASALGDDAGLLGLASLFSHPPEYI